MLSAQTNKHEIRGGLRIESKIHGTPLIVPDSLDDLGLLIQQLKKEQVRYKDAPIKEVLAAIKRGEVKHTKALPQVGGENRVLRGFYSDFFARLQGSATTPSANNTLYIEYFGVGESYAATSFTQTTLGSELYRAVPSEFYDDTVSTFYATTYLKKSQGNPTLDTTVSSSTTTVITVASATGAAVNQRIQVETTLNTYNCTITNVAGSDLTVNNITGGSLTGASAFDAADTPQSGDTVKGLHCEAGVFLGGAATASADTGTLMNRKRLEILKDDSISLLYDYILACVSVE